jgi:hypothetical protein
MKLMLKTSHGMTNAMISNLRHNPLHPITGVESPGSSGVTEVSTPGRTPYFYPRLVIYLPGKFWGFSYSAPYPGPAHCASYPPPASEWQPVKRSPRGIHRPCRRSGWAEGQAATGHIGGFR